MQVKKRGLYILNKIKNMLRAVDPLSAYIVKSCLEVCIVLLAASSALILHMDGELLKVYTIQRAVEAFISMIPLIISEAIIAAGLIDLYAKNMVDKDDLKK